MRFSPCKQPLLGGAAANHGPATGNQNSALNRFDLPGEQSLDPVERAR